MANRPNFNQYGLDAPGTINTPRVITPMLVVTGSEASCGGDSATGIDGELVFPTVDETGAQRVKVTNLSLTNGVVDVNVASGTVQIVGDVATETTLAKQIPTVPTYGGTTVARFLVTGSQSTHLSLLTAPRAGIIAAISASKVFTMSGDTFTPVYFAFDTATNGHAISSADTFAAGQCDVLFPGERRDYMIPVGINGLIVSASVTSSISLAVSS